MIAELRKVFREAVCIDAMRVYDSCCDKDCLEDLRVYFTREKQCLIEDAVNVRLKDVNVIMEIADDLLKTAVSDDLWTLMIY